MKEIYFDMILFQTKSSSSVSLPLGFFRQRAVVEKNLIFFSPFCVYYFGARLIEVLIWHGRPHSNGPIFNGKGEKNPARLPFISLSTKLADNGPSFPTR
jgi:hypothetical protein